MKLLVQPPVPRNTLGLAQQLVVSFHFTHRRAWHRTRRSALRRSALRVNEVMAGGILCVGWARRG
jgi:hypothetical protein